MIDGREILCYAYFVEKRHKFRSLRENNFQIKAGKRCHILEIIEQTGMNIGKTPNNFPIPLDKTRQFDYYEF